MRSTELDSPSECADSAAPSFSIFSFQRFLLPLLWLPSFQLFSSRGVRIATSTTWRWVSDDIHTELHTTRPTNCLLLHSYLVTQLTTITSESLCLGWKIISDFCLSKMSTWHAGRTTFINIKVNLRDRCNQSLM